MYCNRRNNRREFHTFHGRTQKVIEAAIAFTKGRIPVVAGTGSNCTATAVQLSQEAEEAGADGLLIVTPYYNKATQGGLIRHYTTIARSVKTPIIMYNVPSRTGCNILPETAATLFKNETNIVGLKEATGSLAQASKTMDLTDGKLDLYSGEDGLVVPLMSIGAIGVISVWSNVAPKDVHDMCMSYLNGDTKKSIRDTDEGSAVSGCTFLRGQSDPGEKSIEPDGNGSRTASSSADRNGRKKCKKY